MQPQARRDVDRYLLLTATLRRKCRHENIIMFMGACTIAPNFCIVTEWCEGSTLYNLLHIKDVKLSVDDILEAANETARGMGYGGSALADSHENRICGQVYNSKKRVLEFEGSPTLLCIGYPLLGDACLLQ
jgi:serine/threonine protein kinase